MPGGIAAPAEDTRAAARATPSRGHREDGGGPAWVLAGPCRPGPAGSRGSRSRAGARAARRPRPAGPSAEDLLGAAPRATSRRSVATRGGSRRERRARRWPAPLRQALCDQSAGHVQGAGDALQVDAGDLVAREQARRGRCGPGPGSPPRPPRRSCGRGRAGSARWREARCWAATSTPCFCSSTLLRMRSSSRATAERTSASTSSSRWRTVRSRASDVEVGHRLVGLVGRSAPADRRC